MIYAIEAEGTGFVKFGKARDVLKRLGNLQIGSPYRLKLIASADWPDAEESLIHLFLEDSHERGEWFRREGRCQQVIDLMRDLNSGLDEWQRLSRFGNHRSKSLRLAVDRKAANG